MNKSMGAKGAGFATQPNVPARLKNNIDWRFMFNASQGARNTAVFEIPALGVVNATSGAAGMAQAGTGTEYIEWPHVATNPWQQAGSRSITIHAIAEYSSTPTLDTYQTVISAGFLTDGLPLFIDFRNIAGVISVQVGSYLNTNNAFGSWAFDAAVWPVNTPATFTAGFDQDLDSWVMYINGVKVALAGAGLNLNPNPWNATELSIGRVGTGVLGRNWKGKIYAAGIAWNPPHVVANAAKSSPWQIFERVNKRFTFYPAGDAGITAAITGQSLSVSQGSLTGNVQASVTGQALTVSQGAVVGSVSTSITGQSLTLSQGQVTAAIQVAITGQALSVAQGALTGSVLTPITGQALNVALGNVSTAGEVFATITGQALSVYQGQVIAAISPTITGQLMAVSQGALTGDITSSITGNTLIVSQGQVVAAVNTAITGQALTTLLGALKGNVLTAITGQQLNLYMGSLSIASTETSAVTVSRSINFKHTISRSINFKHTISRSLNS